jgi:hypothetical protein
MLKSQSPLSSSHELERSKHRNTVYRTSLQTSTTTTRIPTHSSISARNDHSMETPTNHTASSFFRDLGLEPDDTSASLDENSSIEESNIFADPSAHSRRSAYVAVNGTSSQSRRRAPTGGYGQPLLVPLDEEEDAPTAIASKGGGQSARQDSEANGSCAGPEAVTPTPRPPSPPPPSPFRNKKRQSNSKLVPSQLRDSLTTTGAAASASAPTLLAESKPLKSVLKRPTFGAYCEEAYHSNTTRTAASAATTVVSDPSGTTAKTFDAILGSLQSETLHTSNMALVREGGVGVADAIQSGQGSSDNDDRVAVWAVHAAMAFFCGLVAVAVILSFIVMRKFGLIALVGLMLVMAFVTFLACFVDQTILAKSSALRPVRQKVLAMVRAAPNLLVEEYQLFVTEYNEHVLLLTNGDGMGVVGKAAEKFRSSSPENINNRNSMPNGADPTFLPEQASSPRQRRKSRVFRVVKPLLGLKTKLLERRKNQGFWPSHHPAPSSSSLPLEYEGAGW